VGQVAIVTHKCYLGTGGVTELVEKELMVITGEIVNKHFISLKDELKQAGWITERNLLGPTGWRYSLSHDKQL